MAGPLITIGITCYNARETIERAIRSAQRGDWDPIEILVVDDAGTDGSAAIVEAMARDDARIRLIRHPVNRGVAAARNTIIGEAQGEFIAFLDDDDEMLPDRLRLQYSLLLRTEREVRPVLRAEAGYGDKGDGPV